MFLAETSTDIKRWMLKRSLCIILAIKALSISFRSKVIRWNSAQKKWKSLYLMRKARNLLIAMNFRLKSSNFFFKVSSIFSLVWNEETKFSRRREFRCFATLLWIRLSMYIISISSISKWFAFARNLCFIRLLHWKIDIFFFVWKQWRIKNLHERLVCEVRKIRYRCGMTRVQDDILLKIMILLNKFDYVSSKFFFQLSYVNRFFKHCVIFINNISISFF